MFEIEAGLPEPIGPTLKANGANFAIYSENAEKIEVCLFDASGTTELQRLELPARTGDVWHGFVPGAGEGLLYGYRVHGRHAPQEGHRFNANKLLVDPYARSLAGPLRHHAAQFGFETGHPDADQSFDASDSAPFMPKCRLVAPGPAADPGPRPRTPLSDTVIYEVHAKGFTQLNEDIPVSLRGTYVALGSEAAIRHFRSLGITAVELLPIMPFNDEPHLVAKGLTNYWGYNPYCFMAPDPRYGIEDARAELCTAIRRLHEAGIEVLLDVVFNHTGEGWHLGPTLSLKGIDNASYYRLDPIDPSRYVDHAGCGNTLDLSKPHVRRLLLDSLRTWVCEFGIDGFRFDLATTLGREADGGFNPQAETLRAIAADADLAGVKLIAEPWDCGPDGYQLARFPAPWMEWNDKARDTVRRFWRGDDGMLPAFAQALCGSAETFGPDRAPPVSINFVTAHDGMRLRDLVTYRGKRNWANGEDNRDGNNADFSDSYGPEGPTDDQGQKGTRVRQMRNLITTLMLMQGVPMLPAGDEFGQSQRGNNNPYCQDNALAWTDWSLSGDEEGRALFAFVQRALALRRQHPVLRKDRPLTSEDASWLSPDGQAMSVEEWQLPWARCVGMLLRDNSETAPSHLLFLFNAHVDAVEFRLPPAMGGFAWAPLLDTAEDTHDINGETGKVLVAARSIVVLSCGPERPRIASPLQQLAEIGGIAPEYYDLAGVRHSTSPETQRVLLGAMGLRVGNEEVETRTLADLQSDPWKALLPPVAITRFDPSSALTETVKVPVVVSSASLDHMLVWRLTNEDGVACWGAARCRDLEILDRRRADGSELVHLGLAINVSQVGYHDLHVEVAGRAADCTVIAAPTACFQPPWMVEGRRVWGVAHQLYSLRSDVPSGVGDFRALSEFVSSVGARGGACVGVNPLHALSLAKPDDASPYAPSSRRFLNLIYIDPASVPEFDAGADLQEVTTGNLIDYPKCLAEKLGALLPLFERFESSAPSARVTAFEAYVAAGGQPLRKFAIHQVLERHFGRAQSPAWDRYRDPLSAETIAFAEEHGQSIRFQMWLQFEADRQLGAAKGNLLLGLYGDLAVGVDPMGADVWGEPDAFVTDVRIGAPPDPFSPTGQEWGLLPFNPLRLREKAYRPFIGMIRAAMRHCGAIRIDHVMWLERMFWVPCGGEPTDGAYVRFPVDDLMAVLALESHRNRCVVVGEDLGTVPDGFRERMSREGLLSYKLMRFERHPDGLYFRPQMYPAAALATPASHDLPTIAGHWSERDIDVRLDLKVISAEDAARERSARHVDRELLVAALVDQGLIGADFPARAALDEVHIHALIEAVHLLLARTPSSMFLLNVEDLAASHEQVNLPGPLVGYPCWRIRLDKTIRQIFDAEWVRRMLENVTRERTA